MKLPGTIERLLAAGITGASEGLFPQNDFGAPDHRDAEMLERTRDYIDELPPQQGLMLVFLFVALELLAPFLLGMPRRFSRMTPTQRANAVRGWRRSRFFLLRVLGDAVKASTTMMYMSHPKVVAHIGEYRTCEALGEGFEVKPNALPIREVLE
jgi:hypothetical protein